MKTIPKKIIQMTLFEPQREGLSQNAVTTFCLSTSGPTETDKTHLRG